VPKNSAFHKACFAVFYSFLLFGLSACGDTTAKPEAGIPSQTVSDKTLYVTNGNGGKLLAFDVRVLGETLTVQGENIPPTRQFPDTVSSPAGIFLDRASDTLYVANPGQNAIQIYDNASTLGTPLQASRTISGGETELDEPFGLSFDATSNRLFVANKNGNSILGFCLGGSPNRGNLSPCNVLKGHLTLLDAPRSLAVDSSRKRLYISNMGNNSILVYKNSDTIGATASECVSDFSLCNIVPTSVISPHSEAETASRLELPFGIHLDSINDRLYVVNTGQNSPAIFIYESASTLSGTPIPERVLTGLNTDLTVPAGIDVDEATGRLSIINNNSPNNVNVSGIANTDSPSLLIFNDILTTCTVATHLCDLSPDRRAGGDVSVESGTTLTHPVGIAYDPGRDITYVANTGGNNIIIYSVEGDVAPIDENKGSVTLLDAPSSFFYDETLDRLYVSNASTVASPAPFIVYDQLSNKDFENTAPSWRLAGSSNFETPMGIHIDKTRELMLFLNAVADIRHGLYIYDLTQPFTEPDPPNPPKDIAFPLSNAVGPTGKTLFPPGHQSKSFSGLSAGSSSGMTVDETRGQVYVSNKSNNSVVVYDYSSPPGSPGGELTLLRTITGFDKPSGLFIDSTRDILYVSNNGEEPGAVADYRANTVFVFEGASTKGDNTGACPSTPCPPDRIISTVGLTAGVQNKLKAPISPFVDVIADRLYLVNSASDQNAVFSFNTASTIGDSSPQCIDGAVVCNDTLATKVLIGSQTNLNFSKPGALFIGAVVVSRNANNETLYVASSCSNPLASPTCTQGGLQVFGTAGQLKPSKVWTGGGGSFTTAEAVAVDSVKNVLYVANQSTNTLSVFANANTIDVTTNSTTGKRDLSNIQLNRPAGLFVDTSRDRLYVSNSEAFACTPNVCNAILVFDNASTFADGTTPNRILRDTALNQPEGLVLNPTSQRLYIANTGGDSVLIYNQADTLNGSVTATAILTGFDTPSDVALDPVRDILYVLDKSAKKILVFENASTLIGGESAPRMISGDDGSGNNALVNPSAIYLDTENDLLYLADPGANSVSIFTNASTAEGQAAKKTFLGDKTGLKSPSALTVGSPRP